ncbi:MAG: AGE family epimerase/isomerase [Planctomycetota bacterium]
MLESYAEKYRSSLIDDVVPFWLNHSVDEQYGGVFTCLDRDGTVYDDRKYVWLQGRAIWMFSRLYNVVEKRTEYLDIARSTIDFLRKNAFDDQGRMFFSLTRDGKPCFLQRKIFAAVFYMQGLIEFYRATGDPDCLTEAKRLFERIVGWRDHPERLGRPVLSGGVPLSNLADVMVLSLMSLDLLSVSDEPIYRNYIRASIAGVLSHYDSGKRILRENIRKDSRRPANAPSLPEDRLFIPGHSIEVAWFLLHLLDHSPDKAASQTAYDIIDGSLTAGWDEEYGGLYYFMDIDGRPTLQLESNMKLWWPHTEAIYALVLAYSKTRDSKWLGWLKRVDEYADAHFVDKEYGEWFGYCDRRGDRTHSCKGGNYKGFYHVPRALLFSWKTIEKMNGDKAAGR